MAKLKPVRNQRTKVESKPSLGAAIPCAFLVLLGTGLMGLLFYAMLMSHK